MLTWMEYESVDTFLTNFHIRELEIYRWAIKRYNAEGWKHKFVIGRPRGQYPMMRGLYCPTRERDSDLSDFWRILREIKG